MTSHISEVLHFTKKTQADSESTENSDSEKSNCKYLQQLCSQTTILFLQHNDYIDKRKKLRRYQRNTYTEMLGELNDLWSKIEKKMN